MPYLDEAECETIRGEFQHISVFVLAAIDTMAIASELGRVCESEIEIALGVEIIKAFRVIDGETFLLVPQFLDHSDTTSRLLAKACQNRLL
jgi:hypothetical protein